MHPIRYAHSEGYTEVCFTGNKDEFITTGEDGEIRIWQDFDDTENRSIQVGEKCFALAYGGGKIYVSNDQNEVKKYDLESSEEQGVITSFTLPVTCMALNKANTHLVCGSADFEVHLVYLESLKSTKFSGHEAPILSLCFDPLQKYFISSSCDSTARIWSVANLNMVKQLTGLHAKSNDFMNSESWCKIAWHKDGGIMAVPCKKDVDFYERESWILKFKINLKNENNPNEEFIASLVCFSPDGKHVLAATSTQMIYIHSIINKSLVYKYSYDKKMQICSLVWNPNNHNEILFCNVKGKLGVIRPSIKDSMGLVNEENTTSSKPVATNKSTTKKPKEDDREDLEMDELLELLDRDDNGDDESSNQSSIKGSKSKSAGKSEMTSPRKKRRRMSDEDGENDESSRDSDVIKSKPRSKDEYADVEDDETNDDYESLEKLKAKTYNSVKREVLKEEEDIQELEENIPKKSTLTVEKIPQQKAFQPSSTPLNLPERYMVWNSVGLITQFSKDDDDSIEIEFHNVSYHHTIHLKNQFGYTMADMSKEAVVLASPGNEATELAEELNEFLAQTVSNHSKLTCIMLNSDDTGTKEWNVDMKKEYIRCVCASRLLVACATSRKFMRVFHVSGIQREIIGLFGQPICIAAYERKIFVCYIANNQIGYSIYDISDDRQKEPEHGILPLSGPESQLIWIGFSEEGSAYFLDSNGYLFTKLSEKAWTPVSFLRCDLNHKSDNYWLVGIAERNQKIKAIFCRGSKHPNVIPRPNLTTLDLHVPLCEPDAEKSKLEQTYWINAYFGTNIKKYDCASLNIDGFDQDELEEKSDKFQTEARSALMKLFMLACKSGKEKRAYEVATIMDIDSIGLAIKYATKIRAINLAHNLNNLADRKAELDELNKQSEQQNEYELPSRRTIESIRPSFDDTSDIIIERVSKTNTQALPKPRVENNDIENESQSNEIIEDSVRTPSAIPLTTTRINPFANKGSAQNTPTLLSSSATNANETPKSVINTIEEKITKKNNASSSAKEKDAWKPTPTRKLVKSKVASGNNTPIGSFFNK